VIPDLVRVVPVALALVLVPGWFWARWLTRSTDLAEQVIHAVAFSMVLVSAAALVEVRLTGGGLTLPLAVIAPAAVFLAGAGLFVWSGAAGKPEKRPVAGFPVPLTAPSLVPLALAAALVLAGDFLYQGLFWAAGSCWGWPSPACTASGEAQRFMLPVAALVVLAGAVQVLSSRRLSWAGSGEEAAGERSVDSGGRTKKVLLGLVLLAVLVRGYSGPVLHDWPFIRGVDNYSHAVMANLMLSTGNDSSYLIYPPGFHLLTAEISRLSGVEPLDTFPVVAPLMMLGPTLALYTLGRRMWGWEVGVAAAFFGGFLAGGIYYYFDDAMYPNLTAAQILLVMTIGALVSLYSRPGWRSGLAFAVLGSGVVLYHQVTTLYLVVLLAPVAVFALVYLLLTSQRRAAATLFFSLVLLAVLSVAYAWDTYHIPRLIAHLMDGAFGTGKTASAVEMAIGTQPTYGYAVMVGTTISQPIAWLGLLGLVVSTGSLFVARRREGAAVLSKVTLLVWFLVMLAGSSTSLSGFPQRFGRDISVPLALFAAFALVMLLRSLLWLRGPLPVYAASAAVLLVGGLVGLRAVQSIEQAAGPSPEVTMTPQIAAAGEWLKEHNTGGNIMVSPQSNQVPSRMMLAMGHYSALQSFTAGQVAHPRDLPPHPPQRYWNVLWVMTHPQGQKTQQILKEYDVRYIVLYKREPDRPVVPYWTLFKQYPNLYRTVFENQDVLIVAPRRFSGTG